MSEKETIRIERGRVALATETPATRRKEPSAYWDVPEATADTVDRAARELAANPALDGRARAGLALDEERERLGIGESGWRSGCDCGQRQPCRHAQSLLFRFRQEAKRDPRLWWEAAGVDPGRLEDAVRDVRAQLASKASKEEAVWEARAALLAQANAQRNRQPWMLRRATDPAFWNRDVSFAEWLRPLADAVRIKEETYDVESDRAVDPNVRERP